MEECGLSAPRTFGEYCTSILILSKQKLTMLLDFLCITSKLSAFRLNVFNVLSNPALQIS